MKRDMELVRLMLLRTEALAVDNQSANEYHAQCEKYPEPVRAHHIAIMKEAGLIIGEATTNELGIPVKGFILRLTWQGHDFLDAARNDSVWQKTTSTVRSKGLSLTFDLLKEVLTATIRGQLGI